MQAKHRREPDEQNIPEELRQLGYSGWRDIATGMQYMIPPMIVIPAGKFFMGSDQETDIEANTKDRDMIEIPQHWVEVETYEIAKYPVTVAEYGMFVDATNWSEPEKWKQQKGWIDHPVVGVRWFDVRIYEKWLSEVTGERWRLPSEAEWEKAARGVDGRKWPWGNEWDASKANTWEKGPHEITAIGSYPEDRSPYGVIGMAGNVREWTSTTYKDYPYNINDGREYRNYTYEIDEDVDLKMVTRGGNHRAGEWSARTVCRHTYPVDIGSDSLGIRLVRLRT